MKAKSALLGPGAVFPEVDGLPGAEHQLAVLKAEAQAGTGESGADVGWHVIGPLVVVAVGAQRALAADRPCALPRHQSPQVGRQVSQHPGIGVFIDGEGAAGVQRTDHRQARVQAAGANLPIQG